MLHTRNYNNCKTGKIISISGGKGKPGGYTGETFSILALKLEFCHVAAWIKNELGINIIEVKTDGIYTF